MTNNIKIITLWQPWASEIANGNKHFETRDWATNHRGILVIHAAKRMEYPTNFSHELKPPLGAIVAVGWLKNCIKMTDEFIAQQSQKEIARGYWIPGRFAWEIDCVVPVDPTIPYKGQQGLKPFFDVDWLDPQIKQLLALQKERGIRK